MTQEDLCAVAKNRNTPVLELTIASIFVQAVEKGDFTRLSFLLDRAIGKVQDVYLDEEDDVQALSDNELIRLVKEKLPDLEKAK